MSEHIGHLTTEEIRAYSVGREFLEFAAKNTRRGYHISIPQASSPEIVGKRDAPAKGYLYGNIENRNIIVIGITKKEPPLAYPVILFYDIQIFIHPREKNVYVISNKKRTTLKKEEKKFLTKKLADYRIFYYGLTVAENLKKVIKIDYIDESSIRVARVGKLLGNEEENKDE